MYIGTVPCVFVNNTGYPFQTAGSDTSVIQESGMYHSLHTMFVNACKTKCDRVIEKLDYCARENRKLIP